jgi:hypothetical protein
VAICEFVGGPRDGERFSVPGALPPEQITVIAGPGNLTMWHVAAGEVPVVVCHLDEDAHATTGPWKYRWPRVPGTP